MAFPSPQTPPPHPNEVNIPALVNRFVEWARGAGAWWASSLVVHLFLILLLMLGTQMVFESEEEAIPDIEEPTVAAATVVPEETPSTTFEIPKGPETENTGESEGLNQPANDVKETKIYDNDPVFTEEGGGMPVQAEGPSLGGLGGFDVWSNRPGVASEGPGGVGVGEGTGKNPGRGGAGIGFGGRGSGARVASLGGGGGTQQTERAVAAALFWLSRHQSPDGHWCLSEYVKQCTDRSCLGSGNQSTMLVGPTALGLLPYLAAGQTHQTKGPYQETVRKGLDCLLRYQQANGAVVMEPANYMYGHALATLAFCEAYALTQEQRLHDRAVAALRFLEAAQSPRGGWRYTAQMDPDTSVTGFALLALKSGQMAGLPVNPSTLANAKAYLNTASSGGHGLFTYTQGNPSATMSAVGLLCNQFLGAPRSDPAVVEGVYYMLANLPTTDRCNFYYWYYATLALRNFQGPDWDTWNRKMRRLLIQTQAKQGCAAGSWTADGDPFGDTAGRLYATSFATLTLEVYYRYLPLYRVNVDTAAVSAADIAAKSGMAGLTLQGAPPPAGNPMGSRRY